VSRPARPFHRRAAFLYLLAIVVPTLVLLYLGLQSVRRQAQAVASLTAANQRLSGERLAAELERRVEQLARTCLDDSEIAGLVNPDIPFTPREARPLREVLERIEGRHPVADQLFLVRGGTVTYPLVEAPEPRPVAEDLAREKPASRGRFAALFAEAEKLELLENRAEQALENYRKCSVLSVSDPLKALAVARVARCAGKLKDSRRAEEAYGRLGQLYGDLYDGFYRPYALVAGLELYDLKRARGEERRGLLAELHRDLVRGRWEMGAAQADYFLAQLRRRSPELPAPASGTGYLRRLDLARALKERFRPPAPPRPGELYGSAFTYEARPYQVHYRLVSAQNAPAELVGVAVNLPWVETRLLPQAYADSGATGGQSARVVRRGSGKEGGLQAGIPFQTLFPFWELSMTTAPGDLDRSPPRRAIAVFAGSMLLVLCVLALGVILLLRDVSRETQLNRLRSDFVSAVSHELKTPLTLIRLYTETLLDGEQFRKEGREGFHQIILRESERLTHLIDKALDFSRVDRREKEYHLEEGNLGPSIAQTVQVYGDYLKRRGFCVETNLASSLPVVEFDPDAVAQAVVNLLDNAAKYSGDSKFVGVRLLAEDSAVILEVEDRGIGIPADEQKKIFQQFYRSRTRSGKGGYGLGLFLVKHIMDAHGGRVEVESETGRGSRFRLVFPARLPSARVEVIEVS